MLRRSFVAVLGRPGPFVPPSYRQSQPRYGLVVGAGAGGAAISWRLASLGFSVTCLEQGGYEDYAKSPAADPKWGCCGSENITPTRM